MRFWENLAPLDLLVVCLLLVLARVLASAPLLHRLALPPALLAGLAGMLLGPSVLDLLPVGTDTLESVVYHGLAVLYIAMGLQAAPKGRASGEARSIAFSIVFITLVQGVVGLVFVLGAGGALGGLHPGFGLMLPLGFSQGPGQALALGAAWEASGFVNGGQAGLLMAALGFAWCSVFGVGLYHLGRRLGWLDRAGRDGSGGGVALEGNTLDPGRGDLDVLTIQAALVGAVYLGTWGLLSLLGRAFSEQPAAMERLWGFHFIFALLLALGLRKGLEAARVRERLVDDQLMTRISGFIIDASAVAAIAAVRVDRVAEYWVPALWLSLLGGAITTALCIWLGRRCFPERPFAHTLVVFGTVTGTLPTGLVLLRLEDPSLSGPVSRNIVLGMPLAIALGIPLIVGVLPIPIAGWPETHPVNTWICIGVCMVYAVAVLLAWRFFGPLRMLGRPLSLWPQEPHPKGPHP